MTSLSRRDWLKQLLALPIAATLDVEKLLWVPKPIVTVPALPVPWKMIVSTNAKFSFGFSGFTEADCLAKGRILFPTEKIITGPRALKIIRELGMDQKQSAQRMRA